MEFLKTYLQEVAALLQNIDLQEIAQARFIIQEAGSKGHTVFIVGNGGSAATAGHFACDLYKRSSIRTRSLAESTPLFTALANDLDYASVFSWPLEREMKAGDVLIALSASGSSPNILKAVATARKLGCATVGLTGFEGGELKKLVDACIWVRSSHMEQIEDVHLVLCHLLACDLRREMK